MKPEHIDLLIWLGVGLMVLLIFAGALLVIRREPAVVANVVTPERLQVFEHRLGTLEGQVARTEHDVKNMRMSVGALATKDSVSVVQVQLGEVRGELRAVGTSLGSMQHSLERVEGFLMDAAAKRIAGVDETTKGNGA